jgi:phage recombination protein Bet
MPNIVPMTKSGALTRRDSSRLQLFRRTVGKHLIPSEVDEAIEWCELFGANPFARDIYFFTFDANDAEKRRMVPVLGIGLYRKIAARSGNYRPDDRPPRFTYDDSLISPANPKGIVDCEVTVYRYAHGEWFPTVSRLRWEERAPIIQGGGGRWEDDPSGEVHPAGHKHAGKPKRRFVKSTDQTPTLDPSKRNWHSMPETMLAKCCEADAIRKGWPNETAGSYVDGDLDKAEVIDLTATEIIEGAEREDRQAKIGGKNTILVDWCDNKPLQSIPAGQFHDTVMEFIGKHMKKGNEEAGHVLAWAQRNAEPLRHFWAMEKDAALSVKKRLEEVEAFHKREQQEGQLDLEGKK